MAAVTRYTDETIREAVAAGYWRPELTVDFWDSRAAAEPHRIAVSDPRRALTWAQAVEEIDRCAAGLLALGLPRDARILVQLPNSVELLLFRLACEKAGLVPVYLHVAFRRREIDWIIGVTRPEAALFPAATDKFDHLALYRALAADHPALRVLITDRPVDGLPSLAGLVRHDRDPLPPTRRFTPFEMTGVVTSSGTTGLPKCIEYSPWPRLASGRVYVERLRITEADIVATLIPLYTGGGDMQFHTTPQAGARLVLGDPFTPEGALDLLERERATGAILVPTMLARMLNHTDLKRRDLSPLRFIVSGGGVLPHDVAARAEDAFGAAIIQGYGLMDFGALASHGVDDPREARLRTAGRPLDGNEVAILAPDGSRLPQGEVGEICARGVHTNGGYIGDPEATARAWAGGWFRTGDLGRLDQAGHVVLEGRSKEIIIRGGQNISATEVESILSRHPAVAEVAVVRMPDPDLGERACAFIVPARGQRPELSDIVAFMRADGIAPYKIPERIELIEVMPLTAGGNKIDKRVLEAWCGGAVAPVAAAPAPAQAANP